MICTLEQVKHIVKTVKENPGQVKSLEELDLTYDGKYHLTDRIALTTRTYGEAKAFAKAVLQILKEGTDEEGKSVEKEAEEVLKEEVIEEEKGATEEVTEGLAAEPEEVAPATPASPADLVQDLIEKVETEPEPAPRRPRGRPRKEKPVKPLEEPIIPDEVTRMESNGTVTCRDTDGNLHNDLGPAITRPNGATEWWWHGAQYDYKDYLRKSGAKFLKKRRQDTADQMGQGPPQGRARAIRKFCLYRCMNESCKSVRNCDDPSCPLYSFRLGHGKE